MRDWLGQRVTAVLMALFTLVLLAQVLLAGPSSATTPGPASSRSSG
jgi:succinate dehydrogenase hydrophobic anchor subunit